MAPTLPTQVALPPGIYTIQVTKTSGLGKALTNPAANGNPFTLEEFDANNTDQQVREQLTTLCDITHSCHLTVHRQRLWFNHCQF